MKYLGVDFGLRKIGLAISEGELSSPLQVIHIKNLNQGIKKIAEFVFREKIDKIIIGVPESGVRVVILKAIRKLKEKFDVETIEETLSSKNAQVTMINLGLGKKKRMEEDAYSAAEILQNYLDGLS